MALAGATVETYFSPGGGAGQAAVGLIDGARHRVLLAGYHFTSSRIAKSLRLARERGVRVQVVLDKTEASGRYSVATYLANAGVDVVLDGRYSIMHHKFIVADDTVAFGSMNFTYAADSKNAENFNVFRGAPGLVRTYESEFRRLYAESESYRR